MPQDHRTYLISQALVGAAVNLVLNGAIGWVIFRSLDRIPFSGSPSVSGDLVGTAFLLPLLVCLIATPLVRAEVRGGAVEPAEPSGVIPRFLPRGLLLRGIALGLLAAVTIAPLAIWGLRALGIQAMGFWQFVGFKAAFGAALAALITPVVALRALMDRS
jgi:hypothetical protein